MVTRNESSEVPLDSASGAFVQKYAEIFAEEVKTPCEYSTSIVDPFYVLITIILPEVMTGKKVRFQQEISTHGMVSFGSEAVIEHIAKKAAKEFTDKLKRQNENS